MPRIRSIKPQFWLDENLGTICRDARLLYIGLWNLADDTGVFEWRAGKIRVQLFPYDPDIANEILEEWLGLLVNTGDIIKFSSNGKQFGYIVSFLEHQDIKKPSQWRYVTRDEDYPTSNLPVTNQLVTSSLKEKEKYKGKGKDNREKDNNNKKEHDINEEMAEITRMYEAEIGRISSIVAETLNDAYSAYGYEKIKKAIREAVNQGVRKWPYVVKILKNWSNGSDDLICYQTVEKAIQIARGDLESNPNTRGLIQDELNRRGIKWEVKDA